MSFLSKLFNSNKEENKKNKDSSAAKDKITIETSFATFLYAPEEDEIGYEAQIDWYDKPKDPFVYYSTVECYIDCNTPDTTDASICLERLTRIFEDRVYTDSQVKLEAAKHFADEDGLIRNDSGEVVPKEELMKRMEMYYISVYRDGRICYSLNHNLYDLDIDQTEDTVNVEYNDNGEVSVW